MIMYEFSIVCACISVFCAIINTLIFVQIRSHLKKHSTTMKEDAGALMENMHAIFKASENAFREEITRGPIQ